MSILFTDRLWQKVQPIWESYLKHPFVKGIGEGWLEQNKFKHYLKQDYIYLIEYSRLFALGCVKANDLETMTRFANLLHGTLNDEMELHRNYAEKFNISRAELEATEPSATMTAYTSYMLNVSQRGAIENIVASVLACAWSYNYIGKVLASWPGAVEHELYGDWVRMYASEEFTILANECIALMNKVAQDKPEHELAFLEEIVINTSRFEYMFWDMQNSLNDGRQPNWKISKLSP